MRFNSPIGMLVIVALLVSVVSGWSLYQWQSQNPAGNSRQVNADGQAARGWAGEQIAETAPEFTLTDRYGRERSSDEWEGRIRVVNFWATWCAPCREEIPLLMDLHREHSDRGLTVLGVALDDPEAVGEFADEFNINYPVLVGEKETRRLAEAFGSDRFGLPHTIIVDPEGQIAGFHLGLMAREDITQLLEPLLSHPAQ